MTAPDDAAARRAKWQAYFRAQLSGSDAEVNAATEGAMAAIARRQSVDQVVAAGHAAAAAFRNAAAGGAPYQVPPSPTPTPPVPAQVPRIPAPRVPEPMPISPAATTSAGGPVRGTVTGMSQRQEVFNRAPYLVWNFRVERVDAMGNRLDPVAVEMIGRRFLGAINNGDVVEIDAAAKPGKLMHPKTVRNLTSNATVRSKGKPHRVLARVFGVLFVIVFVIFAYEAFKNV
jgi:hypothetical protein